MAVNLAVHLVAPCPVRKLRAFIGYCERRAMSETLRPIERRILAMRDGGESVDSIAGRLRRSPEHVERIIAWTDLPRSGPASRKSSRARERRVLALRARGETYDQIGARFGRGAGYIKQVEGLAHYRLALELLG